MVDFMPLSQKRFNTKSNMEVAMFSYRSRLKRFVQALCLMAGVWQGSTSLAANSRFIAFNSDASTEISTNKVYTHCLDFGRATGDYTNTVINSVAFTNVSSVSGTTTGTDGLLYGWSGFPSKSDAMGQASVIRTPAGNNIRNVLYDANYGLASGTLKLTGLTPGQKYEVRFYNRTWQAGSRYQTFTFQPGTAAEESIYFNEDDNDGDKILACAYVADANGELSVGVQAAGAGSYHLYGMSNEKILVSFFSSGTTVTNDNGHYSVGAAIGRFNPGAALTLVWGLSPDAMIFTNTTTSASAGQRVFVEATNIVANTSYFYQMFITEGGAVVDVAANEVDNFFTGERDVWVTQSGTMNEAGPTSGIMTFHRTGSLDEAVTVNYQIGGTAVAGLDYNGDGINGTLVIPAGTNAVDLALTPIRNFAMDQSLSVSATLLPGSYTIVEPSAQQFSIVKSPTTYVESTYSSGTGTMVYRVYTPDSYSTQGGKLPVVLYLHSAAERGSGWTNVFITASGWRNNWINNLISETQVGNHQAVLVIPQSGAWQVWNSMNKGDNWGIGNYTNAAQGEISPRLQLAKEILDSVVASYNVDADRLYLTGASMGGYGAWDMLDRFPNTFAAAMPLSGGGNTDAARTRAFASTPVWAYHGAQDTLIKPDNTKGLVTIIRRAGGKTLYSNPASQGHGGFDLFYQNGYYTENSPSTTGGTGRTVYDWLFAQKLSEHSLVLAGVTPIVLNLQIESWINDSFGTTADGSNAVYYAELYPSSAHGGGVTDIPNINGVATGISVSYVSGAFATTKRLLAPDEYAQYKVTRTVSPEVASRFPLRVYMHGSSGSATDPLTFRFSGLKPDWRYTFEFFAGWESWGTPAGETQFTLIGATTTTGTLAAATNYEKLLTLPRILPAADGTVVMSYAATSGSDNVMNCMRIVPIEPVSSVFVLR